MVTKFDVRIMKNWWKIYGISIKWYKKQRTCEVRHFVLQTIEETFLVLIFQLEDIKQLPLINVEQQLKEIMPNY